MSATNAGDGYHALESLIVFAENRRPPGNHVWAQPYAEDNRPRFGEKRSARDKDNLVLKAARARCRQKYPGDGLGRAYRARKRIFPLASGIGGGSADAAANIARASTSSGALKLSEKGIARHWR